MKLTEFTDIYFGHNPKDRIYTNKFWTELNKRVIDKEEILEMIRDLSENIKSKNWDKYDMNKLLLDLEELKSKISEVGK